MDIAQLVLVLLSCVMFVAVVSTLVRAGRGSAARDARVVHDTGGEGWLTLEEVAKLLQTEPDYILDLVDRDSIPFFIDARSERVATTVYWFRRDEIDAWVIG